MKSILSFVVAMDDGNAEEAIKIVSQGDCLIEIQIWIEVYDEDSPQHPLWPRVRPALLRRVEELRGTQPSLPSKTTLPRQPRPIPTPEINVPVITAPKKSLLRRFFDWVNEHYALYMLLCFGIGSILRWYCTGQDINRFISPEPFWPF